MYNISMGRYNKNFARMIDYAARMLEKYGTESHWLSEGDVPSLIRAPNKFADDRVYIGVGLYMALIGPVPAKYNVSYPPECRAVRCLNPKHGDFQFTGRPNPLPDWRKYVVELLNDYPIIEKSGFVIREEGENQNVGK